MQQDGGSEVGCDKVRKRGWMWQGEEAKLDMASWRKKGGGSQVEKETGDVSGRRAGGSSVEHDE